MTRAARRFVVVLLCALLVGGVLAGCSTVVDGHPSGRVATDVGKADFSHGVVLGSGPVHVVDYSDLGCPPCAKLQPGLSKVITHELTAGGVQFTFSDLSFLDRHGPGYSTRAANALLCAADADKAKYLPLKDALFAQQPVEGSPGPSAAQLAAAGAKVGLTSAAFARCVRANGYAAQVSAIEATAAKSGVAAVPTVLVDGKRVPDPTAAKVQQAIDAAK